MSTDNILEEMGRRVSSRRKALGLTQEKVAEKMDVSVQMISNLELGKKAIRPENLIKLCQILNTSADYFLVGKISDSESERLARCIISLPEREQQAIILLVDFLSNNGNAG